MRSARKVGHFVACRDAQLSTRLSLRRYIDELVLQLSSPWRRSIASTLSQLVQTRKIIDDLPFAVTARFVELIQTRGPRMSFMRFLRSLCVCDGFQVREKQQLMLRLVYSRGVPK